MDVAVTLARESFLLEPANAAIARQLVVEQEVKIEQARAAAAPAAGQAQPGGGFAAAPGGAGAASQPGAAGAAEVEIEEMELGAHDWPVESSAISAEDLRINAIVVGIFGLVVLFTVWKMTVSEA
jgi:hypothetical protein